MRSTSSQLQIQQPSSKTHLEIKPNCNGLPQLVSDVTFSRGIVEAARYHAAHPDKPPTYLYCFNVEGRLNRGRNKHKCDPGKQP